ncbi:MAG: hypothetical protein ACYSTF_03615 [Planctomycetota bacterium]|jgi:hypothetical protein
MANPDYLKFHHAEPVLLLHHDRACAYEENKNQPDNNENNAHDLYRDTHNAANLAGLGHTLAGWIHPSCGHLPQIIVPHYPRNDAADEAADDAKYPKHKDDSAAMRRKRLLALWRGLGWCHRGGLSLFFHDTILLKKSGFN